MQPNPPRPSARRGSALITVIMLTAVAAILTASMLSYTLSERRGNERNRLIQRAKNMSENISLFGAEQITTKLYRLRSTSPIAFMTGSNEVLMPPSNVMIASDATYNAATPNMEVRAGLTGSTGLQFITAADSPNAGLQVNTATVPIIAKAVARHSALGSVTAYSQQDLAVDFVPLFQFAVFYNMDMEIWPGADMVIAGPVHCNGELSARCGTGYTAVVQFIERVSSSKGFYANSIRQGTWINNLGGTDAGPGGEGPLRFQHSSTAVVTDIKSSANVWRDHKYGSATETTTTQNNFKVFATTTYGVNLRTSVHGVTNLVLPAVSDYNKVDDPATAEDDRNNGRQVIEPSFANDTQGLKDTKIARKAGLYIIVNPTAQTRTGYKPDGTALSMYPQTYRAFLNTVDANQNHNVTEVILPGQPSYGDTNRVNNLPNRYWDHTAGTTTGAGLTATSIGHNQILRMVQTTGAFYRPATPAGAALVSSSGPDPSTGNNWDRWGYSANAASPTGYSTFDDAYFFDMRRARNNNGAGALLSTGSYRSSNNYTPRPILKIDFDMTRFRMMVERTMSATSADYTATVTSSSIYHPGPTVNATVWNNSIFNPSATRANYNLGTGASFTTFPTNSSASTRVALDPYRLYLAPADPDDARITTTPVVFALGGSDLVSNSTPKPWFDGVTVYIHSVDAELRGDGTDAGVEPDRMDSGVRLWHGRGPVVSLSGTTYPGKTGFTFATNDACYIVGHFNADGNVNTTSTSTTNPGGYSARYPDSANEMLASVMADAVTILSAPEFNTSYVQNSGWNDSLSVHRTDSNNWNSNWASTQPSSSNPLDGIADSIIPAYPMLGRASATTSTGTGSVTIKFQASQTEVSTCFLVGIVPTNHNPTGLTDGPPSTGANGQASGGVHNFPRLLERWGSGVDNGLFIRGSMVAMFESRVAMEPWNLRCYSAPGRYWGLHQSLRSANHDLPLEPILLGARRLGFREITAAEYATQKAVIEALPH